MWKSRLHSFKDPVQRKLFIRLSSHREKVRVARAVPDFTPGWKTLALKHLTH